MSVPSPETMTRPVWLVVAEPFIVTVPTAVVDHPFGPASTVAPARTTATATNEHACRVRWYIHLSRVRTVRFLMDQDWWQRSRGAESTCTQGSTRWLRPWVGPAGE